ncbi:hypothetical protein IHE61_27170 [Streptomyces sp. GKU 257-1]|nr:hypothetical protein [Streptomyces sp. GKU 257-1]
MTGTQRQVYAEALRAMVELPRGRADYPDAAYTALAALDRLREQVPQLRGGPFDMAALARHVLMLGPDATVTPAHQHELLRVARDSRSQGARAPRPCSPPSIWCGGARSTTTRGHSTPGAATAAGSGPTGACRPTPI